MSSPAEASPLPGGGHEDNSELFKESGLLVPGLPEVWGAKCVIKHLVLITKILYNLESKTPLYCKGMFI